MFCSKCGKEINDEWKVCPQCGTAITDVIENKFEKVKFSHQWLIPKLLLIGGLLLGTYRQFIDTGISSIAYGGGWIEFIAWMFVIAFFETWMKRNLLNYAGNKNMMTFGISDEIFTKVERILNKALMGIGTITAGLYLLRMGNNVLFREGFCWESFLEPVSKYRTLFLLLAIADVLKKVAMANRKVTKKDFEEDE